jgi:hypothetical protein
MNCILAAEKFGLKYLFAFFLILFAARSHSQVARDSISIKPVAELLREHPYFNFDGTPVRLTIDERQVRGNEGVFYFLVGLLFFLALMRLIFYKYISTMFTLFFRATLRQQQLREQMLAAPLPALLMNMFFVVVFATYLTLIAGHIGLPRPEGFWTTMMYATLIIAAIYIGKFILLNLLGWILGIGNVTDTYIFVVLLVNKMIAVFLLPFIILLAFPTSYLLPVVLTLSYVLIAGMFVYRFIISYRPVRSEIKLSRLHFFLYLCAFEIAPLLLIYKVLLTFEVSRL